VVAQVPSETGAIGPAVPPAVAPIPALGGQQADPLAKEEPPGCGLNPITGPVSTPPKDVRPAPVDEDGCHRPSGAKAADLVPVQRRRPPDCSYSRHELTWFQRPEGTWTCRTCHP
jgi:hypothetical protein